MEGTGDRAVAGPGGFEPVRLERRDPSRNLARFYRMAVFEALFGDWCLLREWGRIGSPGTARKAWFRTRDEAVEAALELLARKERKGYSRLPKTCSKASASQP
jgi:predicted DNA-binding WGR domain protein